MKRALVVIVWLSANIASADPKHVLVLRAEGSAPAEARTKIDTQVLKLAKSIAGNVEAGDISFSDAAAAVGCSPGDASCRDEVLSTMGVDELVVTNVSAQTSGELKITVKRIAKGAPPKEMTTSVPAGQPADAKMNAEIGPLFGVVPPPPAPDKASTGAALGAALAAKTTTTATTPPAVTTTPPTTTAETAPARPPTTTTPEPPKPADNHVTAAPHGQITDRVEGGDNRRLEIMGMAAGGGLVVVGMIFWLSASSTQKDIDSAPTRTPTDFKNLRDLESKADTYATIGNIATIGGIALGGVSAFFYWRDRSGHSQIARLAPAVFPHGGGITFTVGGAP